MKTLNKTTLVVFTAIFIFQNSLIGQTSSIQEGCAPVEISFNSPSGLSDYFWDFKDGATSTLADPSNTYISPGVYEVELREGVGGSLVGTITISIYPKPELMISASPNVGCAPHEVVFSDDSAIPSGINITDHQWVFGDGNIGSGSDPTHTYNTGGLFTIGLEIETNVASCNVTEIFPDVITVGNVTGANFTTIPNPAVSCEGPFTVEFNNFTIEPDLYTFAWDFGNGETSTLVDPPSQTYSDGEYTVNLVVTDSIGCSKTFTRTVSVGLPIADFVFADTLCINQYSIFDNVSSDGIYTWDFGPNTIPPLEFNPDFINIYEDTVAIFTSSGYHDVTLTVDVGGCIADTTKTVYVHQLDPSFTSDPTYTCETELATQFFPTTTSGVDYYWTFYDSTGTTEMSPLDTIDAFVADSFYNYTELKYTTILTIINSWGCIARDTLTLDTIHHPNALYQTDVVDGCAPLTVEFIDISGSREDIVSYEWHLGDGTILNLTNGGSFTHTYNNVGEYSTYLIITNEAGCTDTSYTTLIEVGESITPLYSVDQTEICIGDTINFQNLTTDPRIDAFHFETDDGRSFHCFNDPDMNWAYGTATGSFDLSFTVEYNGCFTTTTDEDLILVKGPLAEIEYEMECGNPYDFMFRDSSEEATSVTWDFGDGNQSNSEDITHTYDTTGNYMVILTAENTMSGCPISKDTAMVYVREIEAVINLDSMLCYGVSQSFDASLSQDVWDECWRGYDWFTTFYRPITTQDSVIPIVLTDSGLHEITLVVTDINGCKDTATQEVDIFVSRPEIYVADHSICTPSEIQFSDISSSDTTLVSWEWAFGDGDSSMVQNPIHTYEEFHDTIEFVIAELTTTDILGCKATDIQIFSVYNPTSEVSAFPTSVCAGIPVSLSATDYTADGSNLIYNWNFGNGEMSTDNPTSVSYSQGGEYQIQMIYEEMSSGCGDTVFVDISVQDYPIADFTTNVDSQGIICYPENIIFTNNSTPNTFVGYQWDFGNGQTSFTKNPSASFDLGTFEITLVTSTSFSCRDTISKSVTLVGPEGDFDMDKTSICLGETVTFNLKDTVDISSYTWDFGDGTSAHNIDPVSHEYNFLPPTSQTVAKLTLRGVDDACAIAIEYPLEIINVQASFSAGDGIDSILCVGDVLFTNQSTNGEFFNWDFGDGGTSMVFSPQYTYSEAGTYLVQLAIESLTSGCKDTLEQEVIVNPLPLVDIFPDTVCADVEVVLDADLNNPNVSYFWSPGSVIGNPTAANPTATFSSTTTVNLLVTDQFDCENTDSEIIVVFPEIPEINWDTIIAKGTTATVPFPYNPSLYSYDWNTTEGLDCTTCSNPISSVTSSITYLVTVTDKFGCYTVTYTFDIQVFPEEIELPNVFTPNGDNVNDFFNFIVTDGEPELVETIEFKIFNRWGEKVYNNEKPGIGWDGIHNGKPAPTEVYIYILEVNYITGNSEKLSGDFTLIR